MDLTGTAGDGDQSRQKTKAPNRERDYGQKEHGSRDPKVQMIQKLTEVLIAGKEIFVR